MAFPQGEIVHTQHGRSGVRRDGETAQQTQQGMPAHHQVPALTEAHTGRASSGHAEVYEALGEPQRAPGPGGCHRGQPFSKDAATALTVAAKPRADVQLETHVVRRPGEIGQRPFRGTVDAMRRCRTERTWCGGRCRAHRDDDLRRGVVDVTGGEAQGGGIGSQAGKDVGRVGGDESGFLLKATLSPGKRR